MTFSERYGYRKVKETIQIESMDEPLRNGLWSLLQLHCWDHVLPSGPFNNYFINNRINPDINNLCQLLWLNHFKRPLDELSDDWNVVHRQLRHHFFDCEWYDVYEFVEFVANHYARVGFKHKFTQTCNALLERELSAYRFVSGILTQNTEKHEVAEIEQAIKGSRLPVRNHLHRSLELLSDRKAPDYRNAIKEAISAVESLVTVTVGSDKGTLGQLIKKLENEIGLHPGLRAAFSNLYGYTSDENGIRHALTERDKVDFNDAKFMLVVCSAFVNYVAAKLANNK